MKSFSWRALVPAALLFGAVMITACQPGGSSPGRGGQGCAGTPDDVTNGLDPAESPVAGAFYRDGSDADVRARTDNFFKQGFGFQSFGSGGTGVDPKSPPADERDRLQPFRPGSDELWIFTEGPRGARAPQGRDGPGCGDMVGRNAAGTVLPLPLQHTDVHASVCGYLSTVDVEQKFANPYAEKIEAVYVFPLPDDAAVRDFVMVIGERQIRGIIRKREEAKQIYQQARAQGYHAALLEQARPNVFEQAVANLEPGRAIDIRLRYFHTLAYGHDGYEFVFPMVVGPRYNPAGWNGGIGALSAGCGPAAGAQPVNVNYLPPETRPGNDLSLAVDVDAGLLIGAIASPSHAVVVERPSPTRALVRLDGGAAIPNRDFVLRFAVAGSGCRAGLMTHADGDGGYLTLMVHPPDELRTLPRQRLEMVFVVDCSGSMDGAPLMQAKAAVDMALQQLGLGDSVQVIRFGDDATLFAPAPVPATEGNVAAARRFVDALRANGGTEMLTGMRAALDGPRDPEKLRCVVFATDGFIGNEKEVFAAVRERLGSSRILGLGVGSSVNRWLIEGIARLGRGAAGFLLHDEAPGRAVAQLWQRIGHPALTDVRIDWGGATVDEVFPPRLPDLFAGRPVVVTARYHGPRPTNVRLLGRVGGGEVAFDAVTDADHCDALAALPAVWARRKIQSLSDFAEVEGRAAAPGQVEALALTYGLMSAFTSFVAVDASGRTAGDHGTTVAVPVPMPAGVRYDTTVSNR
jgi:Ca-activated chloride channel family protein